MGVPVTTMIRQTGGGLQQVNKQTNTVQGFTTLVVVVKKVFKQRSVSLLRKVIVRRGQSRYPPVD